MALACTDLQAGRTIWTMPLLAERLVALAVVEGISTKPYAASSIKRPQALAASRMVHHPPDPRVCLAHRSPNAAIGRGMKASKEAMVGLWVALDRFMHTDHEAERRVHLAEAADLASWAAGRHDLRAEVVDDWDLWPAPVVCLFPVENRWSPTLMNQALVKGEPSIHLDLGPDCLMLSTHCLQDGDLMAIMNRLQFLLDQSASS